MSNHKIVNIKRCNHPKNLLFNCMIHHLKTDEDKIKKKSIISKKELPKSKLNIETKCYHYFHSLATCLNRNSKITWSGPS